MGSSLLGLTRLALYAGWTFVLIPVQIAALALRLPARRRIPRLYHRVVARLLGIEIAVRGTPSAARPTLFVANHSSYLDIEVLGALIDGSFVAKSEVAGWPLFGLLAKLQETVFVNRTARREATRQRDALQARLAEGDRIILFAEGTSSDGCRTLPFKTALFSAASTRVGDAPLAVQPVSIAAAALDGIPMGRMLRPFYAWYGDMDLAPHIWDFVRLGRVRVEVEFHPVLDVERCGSRKALADACWRSVADGVAAIVAGRPRVPVAADAAPPAAVIDSAGPAGASIEA